MTRLLLAAFFVFITMAFAIGLGSAAFPNAPVWLAAPALAIVFITLLLLVLVIFQEPIKNGVVGPTIEELNAQGLLVSRRYRGVRAIQVAADFDEEGPYYMVEVDNGEVLFLSGSELQDYEPIDCPGEPPQLRRFPCREFVLSKHKTKQYLVDVQCLGEAFEPDLIAPTAESFGLPFDSLPSSGELIPDVTFDDLASWLQESQDQDRQA